ncbi:protein-ADP-ribose hydrolase [Paenibacillus shenyangensis]|uniref:protein-ADP-ribose hydrolase n=1 Tax=Paenibacillus sp. A9 TaxID=1284352 RepID=UPI00037EC664|nr:protein-ADP-ribose hydrolase [Paenibacillus sp. A9]
MTLTLDMYLSLLELDHPFLPLPYTDKTDMERVNELLHVLLSEYEDGISVELPSSYEEKRLLLKKLLTLRKAQPLPDSFHRTLDDLLQSELRKKEIVNAQELRKVSERSVKSPFSESDRLVLWQGDITTLHADAIVNAANSALLGCFQPGHACIDNAIHAAAGPRLREDCHRLMIRQGHTEPTGEAKLTRAYNLPASYVIHTVGPIVANGRTPTEQQKKELASCYISCLDLTQQKGDIRSLAFCAISTGIFGFPKEEAARIALQTVNQWLQTHDHALDTIIFNVFGDDDYEIYAKMLYH